MAKNVKASVYLKRRFRKAKQVKGSDTFSFKNFVRKLRDEGDVQAIAWFLHRSKAFNYPAKLARLKNKGGRIAAEKSASSSSKRKKSGGKSSSTNSSQ